MIVPRKYSMPIISAVGLFCYDKFEETPNEKVVNMSKLTKTYFRFQVLFYLIKSCVVGDKGAPPIKIKSILPPSKD